jgi:hypothetical protein
MLKNREGVKHTGGHVDDARGGESAGESDDSRRDIRANYVHRWRRDFSHGAIEIAGGAQHFGVIY